MLSCSCRRRQTSFTVSASAGMGQGGPPCATDWMPHAVALWKYRKCMRTSRAPQRSTWAWLARPGPANQASVCCATRSRSAMSASLSITVAMSACLLNGWPVLYRTIAARACRAPGPPERPAGPPEYPLPPGRPIGHEAVVGESTGRSRHEEARGWSGHGRCDAAPRRRVRGIVDRRCAGSGRLCGLQPDPGWDRDLRPAGARRGRSRAGGVRARRPSCTHRRRRRRTTSRLSLGWCTRRLRPWSCTRRHRRCSCGRLRSSCGRSRGRSWSTAIRTGSVLSGVTAAGNNLPRRGGTGGRMVRSPVPFLQRFG